MSIFYQLDLVIDILIQNNISFDKKQILGFWEDDFNELKEETKRISPDYRHDNPDGTFDLRYAGCIFLIKNLTV